MNENKFLPDDPKLTAYALGELEGAELAAVKRHWPAKPRLSFVLRNPRESKVRS